MALKSFNLHTVSKVTRSIKLYCNFIMLNFIFIIVFHWLDGRTIINIYD